MAGLTLLLAANALISPSDYSVSISFENVAHARQDGSPDLTVSANSWKLVRMEREAVFTWSNAGESERMQAEATVRWVDSVSQADVGILPKGAKAFTLPDPCCAPLHSQLPRQVFIIRESIAPRTSLKIMQTTKTVIEWEWRQVGKSGFGRCRDTKSLIGFEKVIERLR